MVDAIITALLAVAVVAATLEAEGLALACVAGVYMVVKYWS